MTDSGDGDLCLGLISGTSADGIDAALVRIRGAGAGAALDLLAFASPPYPEDVRAEVLALPEHPAQAVARLCSLNVRVGECFAAVARDLCRDAGVEPSALHVVGSHGQTVWHQPGPDPDLPGSVASTLQIGEPAVIAARLGCRVVGNFRSADMAAGGQGAPLVPYYDWVVLRHPERSRAVQNIGGIGNVTALPANAAIDAVRAFDTGPGNMVIDGVLTLLTNGAATFDRDGALAAAGTIDRGLLDRLLADDYLGQPPPKTTGRERYGLPYCRDLLARARIRAGILAPAAGTGDDERQRALDLLATVTALTARSIADAYQRWLPPLDEILVGGGGSRNPTLMAMLRDAVAPIPVSTLDDHGIDGRAKEAIAFALMAHDALLGLPTNVPGATGASRAVPLGQLTLARDPRSEASPLVDRGC